jgi:hypothetical protein
MRVIIGDGLGIFGDGPPVALRTHRYIKWSNALHELVKAGSKLASRRRMRKANSSGRRRAAAGIEAEGSDGRAGETATI